MGYKLTAVSPECPNADVCIIHTDDNGVVCIIPQDPDNYHYQVYLNWLAEGNTVEPAD